MPDAAMEVLLPLFQRFQTGNVKGPQQLMRQADDAIYRRGWQRLQLS
jgi:hypothetical protein